MKKIAFLHIPKTGGTTINFFFRNNFTQKESILYVEEAKEALFPWIGAHFFDKKYLGAHLPLPHYIRLLGNRNDWFVFTFIRNPVDHLYSHLCHVRDKPAFERDDIDPITNKIKNVNLNCSMSLKRFLDNMDYPEKGLFDNCQTRYLTGFDGSVHLNDNILFKALEEFEELDFVDVTENIDAFLIEMSTILTQFKYSGEKLNKNQSSLLEWKENTEILEVIDPYIKYDNKLYQKALAGMGRRNIKDMLKPLNTKEYGDKSLKI